MFSEFWPPFYSFRFRLNAVTSNRLYTVNLFYFLILVMLSQYRIVRTYSFIYTGYLAVSPYNYHIIWCSLTNPKKNRQTDRQMRGISQSLFYFMSVYSKVILDTHQNKSPQQQKSYIRQQQNYILVSSTNLPTGLKLTIELTTSVLYKIFLFQCYKD